MLFITGDPDDRSLRALEDHLITKRMREESKNMCPEEDKVFGDCLREGGFFWAIRCRPANQELKKCQFKWFNSEEFRKKITEQYLDDRAEFRRTGITQKYVEHERKKEKEFQEWLKHKQEHSETHAS
ncbi:COX assembly mitochondrial protein homolog [Mercenaria mercenaria]|uniref:COX assembly mitochondrial protein homolog n=1 Tax=Mercenaria mercenaria TaxID=6596 RepID=UPI00234EA06F|nr:COX assembly mitochondrial protein homolog [Mercenaria mercenaria]